MKPGILLTRKNAAWFLGTVVCLAGALLLINGMAASYYRDSVRKRLVDLVDQSTAHLYRLRPGSLGIDFLRGEVSLHGASLELNPQTWERQKLSCGLPANRFQIAIPEVYLQVKNFHKALFFGEAQFSLLKISGLHILVVNDSSAATRVSETASLNSVKDTHNTSSPGFISRLQIENIKVENSVLDYSRCKMGRVIFNFHATGLSFSSKELSLGREDFKSMSLTRLLAILNYRLTCKNFEFKRAQGRYLWRASDLEVLRESAPGNSTFLVKSFSLLDANPEPGAGRRGRSDDRLSLASGPVQIEGINLFRILETGKIKIPHVLVQDANFSYLSADTTAHRHIYRMPQEFLREAGKHLCIDSLEFKNLNVIYEEIPARGGPPGLIRFAACSGMLRHISNDSLENLQSHTLSLYARTRLYGTGPVEVSMDFNLENTSFNYSLRMGNFALRQINAITIPLSDLAINRGYISSMTFDGSGDAQKLGGKLALKYRNLSLRILGADTGRSARKNMRLINTLANAFLVLDDNPLLNEPLRTAQVNYHRVLTKSFFNYFWKSLLSGIKPSIGLNPEREKEIENFRASFNRFKSWQMAGKPARLRKRQLRRQRRFERKREMTESYSENLR